MEMFQRILKTAVEGGASDVHLKIGTPVVFRINRQLIAIECPVPAEDWMNNIVKQVTPVHLRQRLEEQREIDFSYYLPSIGRFPHESVSTAGAVVPGHEVCQDHRSQL